MPPPDAFDNWVDLVHLRSPDLPASVAMPRRTQPRPKPHWRRLALFALLVLLPTGLATGYFGWVAPDRYVAEARFIVRKPGAVAITGRGAVPGDQAVQSGDEDAFAVRDFVLSRDGMAAAVAQGGLREAVRKSGPDPLWRFPTVLGNGSDEALYRRYLDLVTLRHETGSGISTLQVLAFDPQDARRIAESLTEAAEAMLSGLQTRAREEAIRVAAAEVERTRAEAERAEDAVTAFRSREATIDPDMLAQTVFKTIATLTLETVEASAQLDLLQHSSPGSPQIPPLRSRVAALQAQIDRERASLAGVDTSLAPRIAEYERLRLARDFAVRNLSNAVSSLEAARVEAMKQRVYLERVVEPRVGDEPAEPYRVTSVLVVLATGLALFWLFRPAPRR